jgi:5-methylcytosine-specific restriction endonuclease McrA
MLNRSVLVLNRHWIAVHVCSVRRALTLLYQDMARVVTEDYQTFDFDSWRELSEIEASEEHSLIKTPNFDLIVPEVILLRYFGRLPQRSVKFNRRNIFMRDDYSCQYCGARPGKENLTIDHVRPRSRGGRSTWENVVLACIKCNSQKGDRMPDEINMPLARNPRQPHWLSSFSAQLRNPENELWRQFVDVAYWTVKLDE